MPTIRNSRKASQYTTRCLWTFLSRASSCNAVGRSFVEERLGLTALNARTAGDALAAKVAEMVEAARGA